MSRMVRIVFDSVYNAPSYFEGIITQSGSNEDVKIHQERLRIEAIEFNCLLNAQTPLGLFLKGIFRRVSPPGREGEGF